MKLSWSTFYFKCDYESILNKTTSYESQVVLRSRKMNKGRVKVVGETANVSVKSYYIRQGWVNYMHLNPIY